MEISSNLVAFSKNTNFIYEITFIGKIGEGKPNTSFCCISISGVSTLPLMVSTRVDMVKEFLIF